MPKLKVKNGTRNTLRWLAIGFTIAFAAIFIAWAVLLGIFLADTTGTNEPTFALIITWTTLLLVSLGLWIAFAGTETYVEAKEAKVLNTITGNRLPQVGYIGHSPISLNAEGSVAIQYGSHPHSVMSDEEMFLKSVKGLQTKAKVMNALANLKLD